MKITINDVMSTKLYSGYLIAEIVGKLFGKQESVTAHDIATAPMIPLRERARLLSYLLGPRDVTREVARRIARDALGNRKIPAPYKAWLDTGDEDLRQAARNAAADAWNAAADTWSAFSTVDSVWRGAWASADVAALAAAWATVDAVTWKRYIGWMAEWLDSHE
jgi:hypothetical protein